MTDKHTAKPREGQKIALVTGVSAEGIGGALVRELHHAGYFVICTGRRPSSLETFDKPGMHRLALDVTSTESVKEGAKLVSILTGQRLDILINNAGAAAYQPALDLDIDGEVRRLYEVNVLGVMRMVQAFASMLIQSKGTIVNIGSIAPIIPLPFSSTYNSSKAALHAYGDSLAMEMKPFR